MSKINIILFLFLIPILILLLLVYNFDSYTDNYFQTIDNYIVNNSFRDITQLEKVEFDTSNINNNYKLIHSNLVDDFNEYNYLIDDVNSISKDIDNKSRFCLVTYDYLIESKLGNSIYENTNEFYKLNIYKLENDKYQGYMAKIKLYDPNSFKLKIADDILGERLPTSLIAKNNNAILAINGGGFFNTTINDKLYTQMIGQTFSDGNIISSNPITEEGFFAAGIDANGHLVSNTFNNPTDSTNLKITDGASFIPVLLKEKEKQTFPLYWQNQKHPRTVISKFANEDLLLIVVDGRQIDYSEGITLENLQDVLLNFGIIDAYNLDGGGSSAFYYNDKLLNKPADGSERYVPNAFLLTPNLIEK
jgi:exopolysaccharide biosynthesis protein